MLAVVLPWLVAIAIASNGDVLRDRDRKKPARQGRDRPAIARRAAGILSGRLSADLLAGIAVRRAGGAVRLGAAARAGGALLPVLDRADLDRLRAGRDQAAALRAADLSGDRLPDGGRAARAGGESGRALGGVRDAGLWPGCGCSSASRSPPCCRSPPGCWKRASIWVGILTALAVVPLLGLTLWLLDKGRRMRGGRVRRRRGADPVRLGLCVPVAASAHDLAQPASRRGGGAGAALRRDDRRQHPLYRAEPRLSARHRDGADRRTGRGGAPAARPGLRARAGRRRSARRRFSRF